MAAATAAAAARRHAESFTLRFAVFFFSTFDAFRKRGLVPRARKNNSLSSPVPNIRGREAPKGEICENENYISGSQDLRRSSVFVRFPWTRSDLARARWLYQGMDGWRDVMLWSPERFVSVAALARGVDYMLCAFRHPALREESVCLPRAVSRQNESTNAGNGSRLTIFRSHIGHCRRPSARPSTCRVLCADLLPCCTYLQERGAMWTFDRTPNLEG